MRFNSKQLAIVIPCLKYSTKLKKVLNSILNQSIKPKQIIVCYYHKDKFFKNNKRILYIKSKLKNQVYQRKLAVKKINKTVEILIQLDDKIELQKNCLSNLIKEWNNANKNVAGIGLNCINFEKPRSNFFHRMLIINSNRYGEVLQSGFPVGWGNIKKNYKSEWLNGGMTSWRFKFVKNRILKRKFPNFIWSITEDLDFSYDLGKKYNLLLAKSPKVKNLKTSSNYSIRENFRKGILFSILLKLFVNKNRNLSLSLFYYSIITSSSIGFFYNILLLNKSETCRHLGKIIGLFYSKKLKSI